jgi:hypothetical protein
MKLTCQHAGFADDLFLLQKSLLDGSLSTMPSSSWSVEHGDAAKRKHYCHHQ